MARRTRSGPCVWQCLHVKAIAPSQYCISFEPGHINDSGGNGCSSEARSVASGRCEPVKRSTYCHGQTSESPCHWKLGVSVTVWHQASEQSLDIILGATLFTFRCRQPRHNSNLSSVLQASKYKLVPSVRRSISSNWNAFVPGNQLSDI